jgi:transcription elongation factor GreA
MAEVQAEQVIVQLLEGGIAVNDVPMSLAVEVTEGLADAGAEELTVQLAERALPRLTKKARVEGVEAIWLACCTAGALPLPAMVRAAERLTVHGEHEVASELVVLLIETLVAADRADEGAAVATQALSWVSSPEVLEAGVAALKQLFAEAPNLDQVVQRASPQAGESLAEVLVRCERALRFCPGTFLLWSDWSITAVESTSDREVVVRHPSGVTERHALPMAAPPKVLSPRAHDVRLLFCPDQLKADWLENPTAQLALLLVEHGGAIAVPGLKTVLVPRVVAEPDFEKILGRLRMECGLGKSDLPRYESRRRYFVSPGCEVPPPKKPSKKLPSKRKSDESPPRQARSVAVSSAATAGPPGEVEPSGGRWIDLTALPEVRALIGSLEEEVGELTRELNVDLPVRLEEARAHGDLRENAEYDAAKERLRLVQARIEQLRQRLGRLHELSRLRLFPGRITAMSRVVVADVDTGEERSLRLVPAVLPEPQTGDVSVGTPYARALLGKEAGAVVRVDLPRRQESLEIIRVFDPLPGRV